MKENKGTPYYISPEVTSNKDGFDGKKKDIWALGVILYEMLYKWYPFNPKNINWNILKEFLKY